MCWCVLLGTVFKTGNDGCSVSCAGSYSLLTKNLWLVLAWETTDTTKKQEDAQKWEENVKMGEYV